MSQTKYIKLGSDYLHHLLFIHPGNPFGPNYISMTKFAYLIYILLVVFIYLIYILSVRLVEKENKSHKSGQRVLWIKSHKF